MSHFTCFKADEILWAGRISNWSASFKRHKESGFKLCHVSLRLFFKHWTVSLVGRKAESTDGEPLKWLQHLKVEVFFHFHMQSLSKNTLVHNSLHLCSFTLTPAHFLLHIKPQKLRIFMHFQCPDWESDLDNVTRCQQHKRNRWKKSWVHWRFHFQAQFKSYSFFTSFSVFLYHPQGPTAMRTQRWYQLGERWRLMTAQSATARMRRARGRSSGRPPAVKTSANKAKDWHRWGGPEEVTPSPNHMHTLGLSPSPLMIRVRQRRSNNSAFIQQPLPNDWKCFYESF